MKSSIEYTCFGLRATLALLAALLLPACSHVTVVKEAPHGEEAATSPPVSDATSRRFREALDFIAAQEYARAEAVLQAIIAESPALAGPHLNLGMVYAATGRDGQARQAYIRAIELRPDNAAAYNELGILHRRGGNFAAARAAYEEALRIDPDYALAHRNLGILFDLYLRQPARALSHYRRYQALPGAADRQVELWIAELSKRVERARQIARSEP